MGRLNDLTGQRFGRLTVLYREGTLNGHAAWMCECDCGNTTIVRGGDLTSGKSLTCGCMKKTGLHRTHEHTGTRLYRIWCNIKSRCTNKNVGQYKDYGGRGITVCDEWLNSFETFYEWAMTNGYADHLTVDRINNDGNYCPENCRWATYSEQSRNKRSRTKRTS